MKIRVVKAGPDPTETPHTHNWEDVTENVEHPEEGHWETQTTQVQTGTTTTYIEHPAEGHYEEVTRTEMVREAWDEEVVVVDKPE